MWFAWLIAVVSTALLELMIPGFFMLSVSAGCLGGMVSALIGLDGVWQLSIALVVMVLFIVFLRPAIYAYKTDSGRWGRARLIGSVVTVTEDIVPPDHGRASLSGIEWEAVSVEPFRKGDKAEVASVGGAVLYLRKIVNSPDKNGKGDK